MSFHDNQGCVDLLDKAGGVISLLQDELRLPDASDASYLDKLCSTHERNPYFEKPNIKTAKKMSFSIKHYPSPVEYTVTGFLEKNRFLPFFVGPARLTFADIVALTPGTKSATISRCCFELRNIKSFRSISLLIPPSKLVLE